MYPLVLQICVATEILIRNMGRWFRSVTALCRDRYIGGTFIKILCLMFIPVMDELPEKPCPLQIINLDGESHTFNLNVELLEKILLSEEVKDRKVMVVTVAGAFRQGKSFILNFFLRYLKAVESGGSQVVNCICICMHV